MFPRFPCFYISAFLHSFNTTVKFYKLKGKKFSKKKSDTEKLLVNDEEDDTWLKKPVEKYEPSISVEAETSSSCFLDLNSTHLTSYLADTKDKTGVTSQDLGLKRTHSLVSNPSLADDNDFSLNFD